MAKVNKDFLLKVSGIRCPHWSTIALWTLGILVMTGLTVKDMYPILRDYFNVDKNVQVQIETKPANTTSRPKLHFCIPSVGPDSLDNFAASLWDHLTNGTICPQCEIMANRSLDAWSHCPNIIEKARELSTVNMKKANMTENSDKWAVDYELEVKRVFAQQLQACFVNYLINNYTKNDVISAEHLSWNRPIIYSLVEYLGDVAMRENKLFLTGSEDTYQIDYYNLKRMGALRIALISFVCEFLWIGQEAFDRNRCFEHIYGSVTVYEGTICMQLSALGSAALLDVTLTENYFYNFIVDGRRQVLILVENPAFYENAIAQALYFSPLLEIRGGIFEIVSITYSQQSSVIEKRPQKLASCYNETSANECMWNCRKLLLESTCHCRFFLNLTMPNVGEKLFPPNQRTKYDIYCSPQLLSECEGGEARHDFSRCAMHCNDSCEFVSYQWQTNANQDTRQNKSEVNLKIQARQHPYLEFTINDRDSTSDLISKVGGVFNFYLGLSGLSIVFFLIYIFDSGRRLQRLKQAEDEKRDIEVEEGRRPSIGLWRFRWMQLAANVVETSKESELKTEIMHLKDSLEESKAVHKQDMSQMGELFKMVKEMGQEINDLKASRTKNGTTVGKPRASSQTTRRESPDADIPMEKRSHKKKA